VFLKRFNGPPPRPTRFPLFLDSVSFLLFLLLQLLYLEDCGTGHFPLLHTILQVIIVD
jgi:hypothetical protein